ncbi:MAG: hypothetical protein FWC42_02205 [Proteobacteria bacterium]|nr:hypothetical protein [Pseudomonadota bacterium]
MLKKREQLLVFWWIALFLLLMSGSLLVRGYARKDWVEIVCGSAGLVITLSVIAGFLYGVKKRKRNHEKEIQK